MTSRKIAIFPLLAAVLLSCQGSGPRQEDIVVQDAWVREPPGRQPIAAGYLLIENRSSEPVALIGAQSQSAASVEIHQMEHKDGQMSMRRVEQVVVPARGNVELKPGGFHLMLMGMEKPPRQGEELELTLLFSSGLKKNVLAAVRKGGY